MCPSVISWMIWYMINGKVVLVSVCTYKGGIGDQKNILMHLLIKDRNDAWIINIYVWCCADRHRIFCTNKKNDLKQFWQHLLDQVRHIHMVFLMWFTDLEWFVSYNNTWTRFIQCTPSIIRYWLRVFPHHSKTNGNNKCWLCIRYKLKNFTYHSL